MIKKHPFPVLLVVLIGLLHLPVVFSPINYLLTWFNTDDAFYYFVPARNVAAGRGFTFDGIAPTNGFHPLWMFILIPIFALPGQILPLRVLAALLVLLNAGTALLMFRLARRHLSSGTALLTALAFSLLPIIHNETTKGGVEAGLNAFCLALLLNRLAKTDLARPRGALIAGGAAALAFLARLDNVFLVGLAGAWLAGRAWFALRPPAAPGAGNRLGMAARRGAAYFVPLGLVGVAYVAWNWLAFGTPFPVSSLVKRWWGTLPNSVYGFPPRRLVNFIGQFVTDDQGIGPWAIITGPFYRTAEGLLTLLGQEVTVEGRRLALAGLGLAVLGGVAWLVWENRRWVWQAVGDMGLVVLMGGCLAQITYYKAGGFVAQRTWYWIGEMMWVTLAGGVVLEMFWRAVRSRMQDGQTAQRLAFVAVVLAAGMLVGGQAGRIPRIFSAGTAGNEPFYLQRSNFLEAHTEPGARIGMAGSGSAGYFIEGRTIVNLDGLISSLEYFEAMKSGRADEYLAEIGLDYVFGNAYIMQVSNPYGDMFEGRLEEAARFLKGEVELVLWRFESSEGGFNRSETAPGRPQTPAPAR